MRLTFYSLIMAFLWSNLFLLTLCVCRRSASFAKGLGYHSLAAAFVLSLARIFVPLEFDNVIVIPSYQILTQIMDALNGPVAAAFFKITWLQLLGLLWALGSLLLAVRLAWQYDRAIRFLEKGSLPFERIPQCFQQLLQDERSKLRRVRFRTCSVLDVPMVSGFLSHTIYLPNRSYTEDPHLIFGIIVMLSSLELMK